LSLLVVALSILLQDNQGTGSLNAIRFIWDTCTCNRQRVRRTHALINSFLSDRLVARTETQTVFTGGMVGVPHPLLLWLQKPMFSSRTILMLLLSFDGVRLQPAQYRFKNWIKKLFFI